MKNSFINDVDGAVDDIIILKLLALKTAHSLYDASSVFFNDWLYDFLCKTKGRKRS